MKKIKIMPVLIIVLMFGIGMFVTGCEESDLTSNDSISLLEDRGGINGNNVNIDKSNSGTIQDICSCIELNFPNEDLSVVELHTLSHMLEEEKLARDVYTTLFNQWDERIFSNISKSEQQHMDAILCLYNKYDIEENVSDNAVGVFENVELQALYISLVELGSESLVSALTVGATIEDLDIFDLIDLSEDVDNEDILAVYTELTKGSRNHMRAFVSRLDQNDALYTPQFITPELFESIITSDRETGGSICGDSNKDGNGNKGNKGKKGKKGNNGDCTGDNSGNGGNGNNDCDGSGGNGGNGDNDCDGSGGNGDNSGNGGNGGNGNGGNGGNGNGGNGNS